MPVKESEYYHARVNKKNTRKLRRIIKKTGRLMPAEVNRAIEQYRPRLNK